MPNKERHFTPNPSQAKILWSRKLFNLMLSGRGEGKTTTAVISMAVHASWYPEFQPIRWGVVRDTRRNIGLTTAPSVKMWYPEGIASIWTGKQGEPEKFLIIDKGKPIIEAYCFGSDSLSDLNRFQSLELGGVLIEEPCAAADVSGGVSQDVFAMATTSLRQIPHPKFLICGNMPDERHWVATTWGIPGAEEPERTPEEQKGVDFIRANSEIVLIPKGENRALDVIAPGYRERNEATLLASGRKDLIDRLVEGKIGSPKIGVAVTPEFCEAHIVDHLEMGKSDRLMMFWDWGLTPACIISRLSPLGYLDCLAAFQGRNEGVEQLIGRLIQPWLNQRRTGPMFPIQHGGDPNGVAREASNSSNSAVKTVIQMLGGSFWPGPVSVDDRRDPTHKALNRYIGGKAWVRIDRKECSGLIKALDGGCHYKKDSSGNVMKEEWVKSWDSHIFDAFTYLCAFLIRKQDASQDQSNWRKKQGQHTGRSRTTTYSGDNRTGV